MTTIINSYYKSEWAGLSTAEAIGKAKEYENEVIDILINNCNFQAVIPTRDSIVAKTAYEKGYTILPDLYGAHKDSRNYFIDIKRKNRRLYFNDTGFNEEHSEHYFKASEFFKAPVVILFKDNNEELKTNNCESWFLDEDGNEIWYGNFLDILIEKNPKNPINTFIDPNTGKVIRCFALKDMKSIEDIFQFTQKKFVLEPLI